MTKRLIEENDYQFIYDDSKSIEECNKARKKKQNIFVKKYLTAI